MQVGLPLLLRGTRPEPSGQRNPGAWNRGLPVSVSDYSRSSATGLHTQIALRESEPPRSANRPVSAGRTTNAAQRNPPGTLNTQELRRSLRQREYRHPFQKEDFLKIQRFPPRGRIHTPTHCREEQTCQETPRRKETLHSNVPRVRAGRMGPYLSVKALHSAFHILLNKWEN